METSEVRTFISPLKSVTSHVVMWYPSWRSRTVPLFPKANSWSMKFPSSTSAGVPTEFGIVTSRQWYCSIWWSGCSDAMARFSMTQNGSINKWTLRESKMIYVWGNRGREGKLKPATDNYIIVYAWLPIFCNSCRFSDGCNLLSLGISNAR